MVPVFLIGFVLYRMPCFENMDSLVLFPWQKWVISLKEQVKVGHTELKWVLPLYFGHLNLWIHWNSLMSGICWIWGHNRCDPKIKGYKEFGQGRCSLHPDVRTLHDSLSKRSFVCPTINSHFLCIKGACTVGSPLVSNTLKASPRLERWSSWSRLPVLQKDHIFPLSL